VEGWPPLVTVELPPVPEAIPVVPPVTPLVVELPVEAIELVVAREPVAAKPVVVTEAVAEEKLVDMSPLLPVAVLSVFAGTAAESPAPPPQATAPPKNSPT
jgi:hypothetical protein